MDIRARACRSGLHFGLCSAHVHPLSCRQLLCFRRNINLSLALFAAGLFASTYLVHKDNQQRNRASVIELEERLKTYEDHAPDYRIEITDVKVGSCANGCHVEVEFVLSLTPLNPWAGRLARIFVDNNRQIAGLSEWTPSISSLQRSPVQQPVEIRPPRLSLNVSIRSEISVEKQLIENEWGTVSIPVTLVIGYFTQPRGDVEIERELSIDADFKPRLSAALDYQQRERERIRN